MITDKESIELDTKDAGSHGYYCGMSINLPQPIVKWHFFGDNTLTIQSTYKISRWKRFWCWVFFGSTFEDLK